MDQRLANTWRMTLNEKNFIQNSLLSDLRVDGRSSFDYRRITIKFGREDGSSEVQLGQTHVMGFVTSQLVQPYRDRPKEGTIAIYTEFSPMADPSFEVGRPGESAVELGRIIDRGLRESRAVDTESLCVVAGKLVWSICIDLHIIDNGGNLVDAANIAALAALSTFRRPECTLGGEDGQEVIVHPPEVREPIPLIIHHLPVAVTFGFIGKENTVLIDPTHYEETVMGGRMTAIVNTNGDVWAIQTAGGEGITQSVIMQCLRIASVKAGDITTKIKNAVEFFNMERALRKIKRHTSSAAVDISEPTHKGVSEISKSHMERLKLVSEESGVVQNNDMEVDAQSSEQDKTTGEMAMLRASVVSTQVVVVAHTGKVEDSKREKPNETDANQPLADTKPAASPYDTSRTGLQTNGEKTLENAIKPKHKRKKKSPPSTSASWMNLANTSFDMFDTSLIFDSVILFCYRVAQKELGNYIM